jgi:hypothetical protein
MATLARVSAATVPQLLTHASLATGQSAVLTSIGSEMTVRRALAEHELSEPMRE